MKRSYEMTYNEAKEIYWYYEVANEIIIDYSADAIGNTMIPLLPCGKYYNMKEMCGISEPFERIPMEKYILIL